MHDAEKLVYVLGCLTVDFDGRVWGRGPGLGPPYAFPQFFDRRHDCNFLFKKGRSGLARYSIVGFQVLLGPVNVISVFVRLALIVPP